MIAALATERQRTPLTKRSSRKMNAGDSAAAYIQHNCISVASTISIQQQHLYLVIACQKIEASLTAI